MTIKQENAFFNNQIFEGIKIPEAKEEDILPLREKLGDFDPDVVDFIENCLKLNPDERMNCSQLLEHKYFGGDFKERFNIDFQCMLEKD